MDRAHATDDIRVKVLVVGTSVNFRRIVSEAAEAQQGVGLVGTAIDTRMALSKLERLEIDVVLMDAAPAILEQESLLVDIRERFPLVIPIVISELVGFTTEQEMRIIQLGALDFIRIPARVAGDDWGRLLSRELGPLMEHCRRCVATRKPGTHTLPCSRQGLRQLKREFQGQVGVEAKPSRHGDGSGQPGAARPVGGTARTMGAAASAAADTFPNRNLIPIRVLVADRDQSLQRAIASLVEALPGVELAVAQGPGSVINLLENSEIDVVILEKGMRDNGGGPLLDRVYTDYPHVIPIVTGDLGSSQPSEIKQVMQRGALDYVNKPTGAADGEWAGILGNDFIPLFQHCQRCVHQRKHLGELRRCSRRGLLQLKEEYRRRAGSGPSGRSAADGQASAAALVAGAGGRGATAGQRGRASRLKPVDLVVIGVSTGGPGALRHVIPKLDMDLAVPVLLVIHLPVMFTSRLAEALDKASKINVVECHSGQRLEPGKVFLAPGGLHLSVQEFPKRARSDRYEIKLLNTPHVNGCRPSVDVTLESVARFRDCNVLSVIMTGMGSDGANGVAQIKAAGGYSITQTKETCVIYGMPFAVDRKGLSDESVHLDDIGERINSIVKRGYSVRRSVPSV